MSINTLKSLRKELRDSSGFLILDLGMILMSYFVSAGSLSGLTTMMSIALVSLLINRDKHFLDCLVEKKNNKKDVDNE